MAKENLPIVFGPVLSRRFGKSLGVDLSPSKKTMQLQLHLLRVG